MNALLNQSRFVCPLIFVACFNLLLPPPSQAAQPGLPEDACQLRWEEQELQREEQELQREEQELCGWTSLATHDSPAIHDCPATHDSIAFRLAPATEPASASDTTVDGAITQGAAIAIATAGISVEQLLEPLALATPYLDQSLAKVRQYQSWWGAAISTFDQSREENASMPSIATMEAQLDEIATAEPVDVESYGASVIVDEFPVGVQLISAGEPGIEIRPLNRRVGGSAIIVTIEEAYLPYDLSTDDLKLWSVLPRSTQPFCIRAEHDAWDAAAMWQAFDKRVVPTTSVTKTPPASETAPTGETAEQAIPIEESAPIFAHCGSADCMLDSCIWYIDTWVVGYSNQGTLVTANQLGRRVAILSLQQEQLVHTATNLIASRWHQPLPVGPKPQESLPETSPAGAALLARAGAIATTEAVIEVAASTNPLR